LTPEGKVKAGVKRWLKERGWWWFAPVSNGMGRHGIPDVICCQPVKITPEMVGLTIGVFRAIETKAPGKRLHVSALQQKCIAEMHIAGAAVIVVDDVSQLDGWDVRV